MAALTVRGVPDHVHELLAREARSRGQSLQAYLLSVLQQHATFALNRQLLWDIQEELEAEGGADLEGTSSAEIIEGERARETRESRDRAS